jgi:glycosyltransferase involved in cell wall biosynthesis
MVILEAMAARKAIVTTRVGAIPQVLTHEKSGLLVDTNASSLASAVSRLAQNPDLGRSLGADAFERVQRQYSSERMAEKYAELFDRLRSSKS